MHASLRPLLVLLLALAGCTGTPAAQPLSADTYHMEMTGLPTQPVAPGTTFDVSVTSSMGMGMRMHQATSDHMGAHFWNQTVTDPTAQLSTAGACAHQGGDMPGSYVARCTAPMAAGTYHIRAHARVNETGTLHHWWGEGQTFIVA